MLKGKMEFRLGTEQRVCGPGDVMVNPGGSKEHEAWFHKDTEVIDGAIVKRSYLRFEHSSLAIAVFFFIDCFDRIVSQFVQLRQEYTSPAFDSLSCLVKNLVRAGGMAATSDAAI